MLAAYCEKDELFGLFENDEMLGCMLLLQADPVHWPDDRPGDALYLHKLAVTRSRAGTGVGEALIAFAAQTAISRSIPMLRLDTIPGTPLPDYYLRQGFVADLKGPAYYAGRWLLRMQKHVG